VPTASCLVMAEFGRVRSQDARLGTGQGQPSGQPRRASSVTVPSGSTWKARATQERDQRILRIPNVRGHAVRLPVADRGKPWVGIRGVRMGGNRRFCSPGWRSDGRMLPRGVPASRAPLVRIGAGPSGWQHHCGRPQFVTQLRTHPVPGRLAEPLLATRLAPASADDGLAGRVETWRDQHCQPATESPVAAPGRPWNGLSLETAGGEAQNRVLTCGVLLNASASGRFTDAV